MNRSIVSAVGIAVSGMLGVQTGMSRAPIAIRATSCRIWRQASATVRSKSGQDDIRQQRAPMIDCPRYTVQKNAMSATDLHKTPLHTLHLELGAKMAPFAGYDMPVSYP